MSDAGRISSERMVRASLDRIQGHRSLNAFIHVDEQGALAAARDADARRKDGKGACAALAGVPIVVKDNIHVRGLPLKATELAHAIGELVGQAEGIEIDLGVWGEPTQKEHI